MMPNKHLIVTVLFWFCLIPLTVLPNHDPLNEKNTTSKTEGRAYLLFEKGTKLFKEEAFVRADSFLTASLELAESQFLTQLEFKNKCWLGKLCYWRAEYPEAVLYLTEALENYPNYITRKDSLELLYELGNVHFYSGNIDLALEKRLQSLNFYEKTGDSIFIADGLYAIAEALFDKKEYEEAAKKVSRSLDINLKAKRFHEAGYCYDILANIHYELGEFDQSLELRELACAEKYAKNTAYNDSYCAYKTGQTFVKLRQFNQAKALLEYALSVQVEVGLKEESVYSKLALAEMYSEIGNCPKALGILEELADQKKQLYNKVLLLEVFDVLANTNAQCGKYKEAFFSQKEISALEHTILNEKMALNIAGLSANYELEQKKQELALVQKDNKLNLLYNALLSAAILFLLMLAPLVYSLLRKHKKHNKILQEKNWEIESQYEKLQHSNRRLEEANEDLQQFAYIASHDLKAPLRTIGGYASLIKRRYSHLLDKDGTDYLGFITSDIKHMHQLLEDILAYSRINKGNKEMSAVNLNEMFASTARLLQTEINEKGAKLVVGTLPTVYGSKSQLFQVFQNLIENALKFVPSERQPHITIHAYDKGEFVEIAVQDNGIGIHPSYQEKVFTMFKRLHNKNQYEGTGIGLAICKKIIERHGGDIRLESDGESGTTFFFTLKKVAVAVGREDVVEMIA